MVFATLGGRYALAALHCGVLDCIVKRIHEEFFVPTEVWRWFPAVWMPWATFVIETQGEQRRIQAIGNEKDGLFTQTLTPPHKVTEAKVAPTAASIHHHPTLVPWFKAKRVGTNYRDIIDGQRDSIRLDPPDPETDTLVMLRQQIVDDGYLENDTTVVAEAVGLSLPTIESDWSGDSQGLGWGALFA